MIANEIFTELSQSHFFAFESIWCLSVHLAKFSYHPWSVSLMPPQWKNYSQVWPWTAFESLPFFLVRQAVPTGVLRQGVFTSFLTLLKSTSQCPQKRFYKFLALFMAATHLAFTILCARMTRRLCRFHNSLHETLWTTKVISFFATNQSFDQQLFRDAMMF